MYKHMLVPVDGSELSRKAIGPAIELARQLGAKVSAYHALEGSRANIYGEGMILDEVANRAFDARERESAEKYLTEVGQQAKAGGVQFEAKTSRANSAYAGIIEAAKELNCDLIFMASHGRSGVISVVVGSTTLKVLSHSQIPVLVYR